MLLVGNPFPHGACSLGFGPQYIRKIYGAIKMYDTRAGPDPDFPKELLLNAELLRIGEEGEEYGVTTGRKRTVNWLNLDKLIKSINISGTTNLIVSKIDILEKVKIYKMYYENQLLVFNSLVEIKIKWKKF